jgi:hypothetical protein
MSTRSLVTGVAVPHPKYAQQGKATYYPQAWPSSTGGVPPKYLLIQIPPKPPVILATSPRDGVDPTDINFVVDDATFAKLEGSGESVTISYCEAGFLDRLRYTPGARMKSGIAVIGWIGVILGILLTPLGPSATTHSGWTLSIIGAISVLVINAVYSTATAIQTIAQSAG